jgi:hypothetical protein
LVAIRFNACIGQEGKKNLAFRREEKIKIASALPRKIASQPLAARKKNQEK